jgi:hypothetical protein
LEKTSLITQIGNGHPFWFDSDVIINGALGKGK